MFATCVKIQSKVFIYWECQKEWSESAHNSNISFSSASSIQSCQTIPCVEEMSILLSAVVCCQANCGRLPARWDMQMVGSQRQSVGCQHSWLPQNYSLERSSKNTEQSLNINMGALVK